MADGKGHGQDRQAEGQRDADKADAQFGESGGHDRRPAPAQDQPGRSDEFRGKLAAHVCRAVFVLCASVRSDWKGVTQAARNPGRRPQIAPDPVAISLSLHYVKYDDSDLYIVSSGAVLSGDTDSRILEAALARLRANPGAGLTMAEVAAQAGVSRQAVYLHFADRTALLTALMRHVDEGRGLAANVAAIAKAPSARAAVAAMVALGASDNPGLWPVVRIFDGLRHGDAVVEAVWQDRQSDWLGTCRTIAQRFQGEGALAPHLSLDAAAELLWTLTSPRLWEELVIGRGWSAERYRRHVTYLAVGALTH